MSDLQRSFAKAKLAGLPFNPPLPSGAEQEEHPDIYEEDEDGEDELRPLPGHSLSQEGAVEDDSSSASSASSTGSTGTIKPEPSKKLFARPKGQIPGAGKATYTPIPWTFYFQRELHLASPTSTLVHHAYITPPGTSTAPLFVMHHGAGSSGLSFAATTAEIRRIAPEAGILSIDARGHGETVIKGKDDEPATTGLDVGNEIEVAKAVGETKSGVLDLSLETLAQDLEQTIALTKDEMGWKELPGMILVGHSLGGAVVTHVAKNGKLGNKVIGYVVLDVVEGSAIDALQSMQSYLSSRPRTFPTVESAVEWHIRSRTIRTSASARVSVPSLLKPGPKSESASAFPSNPTTTFATPNSPPSNVTKRPWTWRTDLGATEPFWQDWFVGLSEKFLTARGGKLLLLAGTDRLDKELMIGQMQGKYQLQVYPDAGHFIQEDVPEKTAIALVDFWKRNDGRLIVVPKVSSFLSKKQPAPG